MISNKENFLNTFHSQLETIIHGSSLADYLDNKGYLSVNELLNISLDICNIIHTLHNQQPRIIFTSPAFRMGIVGLFLLTPIPLRMGNYFVP
ncbi:MAG: hypothetical protein J6C01_04920 [Lachnospiraceae bacterium]|nr:hypothetical protein [Lachnospiraceae bacterium]